MFRFLNRWFNPHPAGILSYDELMTLIDRGVIDADPGQVNAASIDVCLDDTIMVEDRGITYDTVIDPTQGPDTSLKAHTIRDHGYILGPGEFVLGAILENLNLPDDIAAEFKLRSSIGRLGMSHCLATWIDPGWEGSITLEIHNVRRYRSILLRPGMPIGQLVFHHVRKVPRHASYATKGRYQGDTKVAASLGVRCGF